MGNSFLVAFNIILPMAIMMAVGAFIRRVGLTTPEIMRQVDKLSFKIFVPALLFKNIYDMNFATDFDPMSLVAAVVAVCIAAVAGMTLPVLFEKDHNKRASIGQAIIRTNYVIFGLAVAASIYGDGHTGTVALIGSVVIPLTNVFSSIILERNRNQAASFKKIFFSVLKNPMVIATALALLCQLFSIRFHSSIYSVITSFGAASNPVCFLSIGVALEFKEFKTNAKSLFWTIVIKSLVLPIIIIGGAVLAGFRGAALCAFLVFGACPTAVSSYPLAVAMDADGQTAGQLVCLTTLVSMFTMFFYISLLTYMHLL